MNMCLYKNISDSIRLYDCPTVMDGHVFTLAWPERKHRHIAIDFVMATVGAEAQKLHEKLDWTLLTMRPPLMSDDDYDDDDIAKMCKKEKMRNTKKKLLPTTSFVDELFRCHIASAKCDRREKVKGRENESLQINEARSKQPTT